MSPTSLLFSHQRETVIALASYFDSIDVFTPEPSSEDLPENVKVSQVMWRQGSILANIYRIYVTVLPTLFRNRGAIVLTHMADVHAALISPFTWIMRMRHVLWYAHASNSIYLVWSSFFISRIVSSTPGSCNLKINASKVRYINQGINHQDFPFFHKLLQSPRRLFYYGRLDESKNIHLFFKLIEKLNENSNIFTLDIFGKPASADAEKYITQLKLEQEVIHSNSSIRINGPIERRKVPITSKDFDIFLNLFSGSLDKTLIECTLMGLPVVTWNREFCNEFGTWSMKPATESLDFIIAEISAIRHMKPIRLRRELVRRLGLALRAHTFDGWINRLRVILVEDNYK